MKIQKSLPPITQTKGKIMAQIREQTEKEKPEAEILEDNATGRVNIKNEKESLIMNELNSNISESEVNPQKSQIDAQIVAPGEVKNREPGEGVESLKPDTVAIDLETYFDKEYSLSNMGTQSYVSDSRFDCYTVAITNGGSLNYVGPPDNAPWEKIHEAKVVTHNNTFDSSVFYELQNRGVVPGDIVPGEWVDTAAMAPYFQAPRDLKGACKELLSRTIDKDYRKVAKGRQWNEFSDKEKELLEDSCLSDAQTSLDLYKIYVNDWPQWEQDLASLHLTHFNRGISVDAEKLQSGIQHLEETLKEVESRIPWVAEGHKPTSPKKARAYCIDAGIPVPDSFAKDKPEFLEWEETFGPYHPWISAMREWREINGLLKRLTRMQSEIREDGRIAVDLKYHGAATGRSSGGSLNLHGLPNGERYGVNIRSMLIPKEGHVFLQADLCQIEPRCIATLMQDTEILTRVREGSNIYEAYARAYLGWTGGPLKKENPPLYGLAKICLLSLGYGTGSRKFLASCKTQGIEMTELGAQKAVQKFRDSQPRIVQQWKSLDERFRAHAGRSEPYVIPLPSGRELRYFDCAYRAEDRQFVARPVRGKPHQRYWGSKLFENAIQATARDVFMQQMLEMERQGLQTLIHIHDEVIVECPIAEVDRVKAIIERVMTTPPDWLPNLPLACEIQTTTCFE
jgi:DNA polymerase I-like protein with 3'-5' exonuclease and polymerase domains